MCESPISENLKFGLFLPHPTYTYICGMTITQKIHNGNINFKKPLKY